MYYHVCSRLIFTEHEEINLLGLFLNTYKPITGYPYYDFNIWLYYTLTEAESNIKHIFQNQDLDEKHTQVHGYLFYLKHHKGHPQDVVALGPLIIAYERRNIHN